MTRKELCKSTGITIKTLRLYEEKGLITPARNCRNGREYREYSPELVRQLQKILLLRRALFTMDEIKCMQEQPEKIPEIFRAYQLWLEQQTLQFQTLKNAADQINGASLSSVDGLIESLRSTAASLPLPQMDIKPNFRRIDALEEPPRHVDEQVDFDETVPNARVLRQMNLVLDRDKSNNMNIAFGQFNELRQTKTCETSGPVQREQPLPKWYRFLSGTATALLALSFILCLQQIYDLHRWNLFNLALILRAVLAVIPAVMEHRRWQKAHVKLDPVEKQAGNKRRNRIVLLSILGALLLTGGIMLLCHVIDQQTNPARDYQVLFAVPAYIGDKDIMCMEEALSPLAGDSDGNGTAYTAVDLAIGESSNWVTMEDGRYRTLYDVVDDGEYLLLFIADVEFQVYNLADNFSFSACCKALPEDLAAAGNAYRADLTGCNVFTEANLAELPVYGCISNIATQEEYEFAVELLRGILMQG